MDSPVVTRFAPSPTGALHVGGARTALFNWAYAQRTGGQFLLRIEDTDRTRSTDASERDILRDLKWLGLTWDNEGAEPRQSARLERYHELMDQLTASDRAYDDEGALRFRMPAADVVVQDELLGEVSTPAGQTEDFIIRKTDGFPTYHFAVVVDDHDMGVTHVIRGQEHLSNTPKHVAIQEALGFGRPKYAHIPLIFNPDGSKMSKRDKAKVARQAAKDADLTALPDVPDEKMQAFLDKATDELAIAVAIARHLDLHLPEIDVEDFRAAGYLPEVMCNYLALLGWNPGNDLEKFGLTFLGEHFDFGRVGKGAARFDREKLRAFNADEIATMRKSQFLAAIAELEPTFASHFTALDRSDPRSYWFAEATQPRSQTLRDPIVNFPYLLPGETDPEYPEEPTKPIRKAMFRNDAEGYHALEQAKPALAAIEADMWQPEPIEAALESLVEKAGYKNLGVVAQPLRVAVSGGTATPPIGLTLAVIGQAETLRRVDLCLAHFKDAATAAGTP